MGFLTKSNTETMSHDTVRVRREGTICRLQLHRPDAQNAINERMLDECHAVLDDCESWANVLLLEGLPEIFCFGADLRGMRRDGVDHDPERLYGLWLKLSQGSFVSVAHVRGKANAGGVGFAAACDLVLCDDSATFGLSELLFGLVPACVLPFLARRVGVARAQSMTLLTQPVTATQAHGWGLVDACSADSDALLRTHLLRLRLLPKDGIQRCKRYLSGLDDSLRAGRAPAVACNREMFADALNLSKIDRYLATGEFPWQYAAAH